MQGPFIATVQVGGPFKMTSEPYTIAGTAAIEPHIVVRRHVGPFLVVVPLLVVVSLIIAGVIVVLVVRKGQAQ